MDYRVDVDFLEHPKTLHLFELAGSDGLIWLLRLWAYTTKHRPSGELSGLNARRIEAALQFAYESLETYEKTPPVNRVKVLVESGWLEYDESTKTYSSSGWKEYQTWVIGAKERSESAKKAAKVLWDTKRGISEPQAEGNAERMRGASESHDAVVDAPSPSPLPSPSHKEKKIAAGAAPRSDHKEFSEYWHDTYSKKLGLRYVFEGKKDGAIVQTILQRIDLSTAKQLVDLFFETDDEWILNKGGFKLSTFTGQINNLLQRRAGVTGKSRPKTQQEKDDDAIIAGMRRHQPNNRGGGFTKIGEVVK